MQDDSQTVYRTILQAQNDVLSSSAPSSEALQLATQVRQRYNTNTRIIACKSVCFLFVLQYCEDVKQRQDSLQYGLYIWTNPDLPGHTSRVKFYALQIFDYRIQHGTQTEKDELKQAFPRLVHQFSPVATNDHEQNFLLEKFSAVVAELAMHEWPQKWPALFSDIMNAAVCDMGTYESGHSFNPQNAAKLGTNQTRIICLLVERLAEETTR